MNRNRPDTIEVDYWHGKRLVYVDVWNGCSEPVGGQLEWVANAHLVMQIHHAVANFCNFVSSTAAFLRHKRRCYLDLFFYCAEAFSTHTTRSSWSEKVDIISELPWDTNGETAPIPFHLRAPPASLPPSRCFDSSHKANRRPSPDRGRVLRPNSPFSPTCPYRYADVHRRS